MTVLQVPDARPLVSAIKEVLDKVVQGAFKSYDEFGRCTASNKINFKHGLGLFCKFLHNTEYSLLHRVIFHVPHELYKGHLLAPHQVAQTARNRELATKVEKTFALWMKQMEAVITESSQVRKDEEDVGPMDELKYWRYMLAKYTSITEFIATREFVNFYTVLKLSRSKWVQRWKEIDNQLTCQLNIATDNARYLSTLERFWNPLYTCAPVEIMEHLTSLLAAVRGVYNTSNYYNTTLNITSFIVKITNQLIIACCNYLTKNYTESIWSQGLRQVLTKIQECCDLEAYYRLTYFKTLDEMEDDPNETPWECSIKYIFGKFEKFTLRLDQVTSKQFLKLNFGEKKNIFQEFLVKIDTFFRVRKIFELRK